MSDIVHALNIEATAKVLHPKDLSAEDRKHLGLPEEEQ